MKIALSQITSAPDPGENLRLIAAETARAAEAGARLVLFPEAAMRAFGHRLDTHAEDLSGPFADGLRRFAREHGVVLAAGMFCPGQSRLSSTGEPVRSVRNTLFLTDGHDTEAAYTKIHLFDAFGFLESDTVDAGTEPVVVTVEGVRIGLALCYDIRFPQLFIRYGEAGCQLTLLAASWGAGEGKIAHWELLAQARALDSTQFIAACGQADPAAAGVPSVEGAPTGIGHSLVAAPDGRVLASLGAEPGLLVVDVDPAAVDAVRRNIPVLANAREIPAPSEAPAVR